MANLILYYRSAGCKIYNSEILQFRYDKTRIDVILLFLNVRYRVLGSSAILFYKL